jgi:hypothetical protein
MSFSEGVSDYQTTDRGGLEYTQTHTRTLIHTYIHIRISNRFSQKRFMVQNISALLKTENRRQSATFFVTYLGLDNF